MRLKYKFVVNEVADTPVAIVVGDDSELFNGVIKLNSTGRVIFDMLNDSDVSLDNIVCGLMDKFDVDKETAEKSTELFLNELRKNDLVIE